MTEHDRRRFMVAALAVSLLVAIALLVVSEYRRGAVARERDERPVYCTGGAHQVMNDDRVVGCQR